MAKRRSLSEVWEAEEVGADEELAAEVSEAEAKGDAAAEAGGGHHEEVDTTTPQQWGKRARGDTAQINANVSAALKVEVQKALLDEALAGRKRTMQDLIEELLEEWLKERQ